MAHFAELNENGIVTRVVVVANAELLDGDVESEEKGVSFLANLYGHGNWKQTSYNRRTRKNYAGIGYAYDSVRDAFIPPKPSDDATLDESTCLWVIPAE